MFPAIYYLDHEANDAGQGVMELVEDHAGFYSRPSQKSMWKTVCLERVEANQAQVYTNLFPARHTWYLLGTVIILNGIDWAGFELLAIGNQEIEKLPTGSRVLDGLFQALCSYPFWVF